VEQTRALIVVMPKYIETWETGIDHFVARFPATIELSICAMLLALLIGLPAGIVAAVKRNTVWDYSVMGASLTGFSMPIFWWGLLLILMFSVTLGWTPVSGRIAIQYDIPTVTGFMLIDSLMSSDKGAFRSALSHLILPSIALGTIPLAVIARMTRSSMLEVLSQDYIRTARAKGMSERRVVYLHGLRNALIPLITLVGLELPGLVSGGLVVEVVFGWPGIGRLAFERALQYDYSTVMGVTFFATLLVVAGNLLADVLYAALDPRIRYA